jgi:signal transduction histidine kinase/ActR/RegA family two-component response regulator
MDSIPAPVLLMIAGLVAALVGALLAGLSRAAHARRAIERERDAVRETLEAIRAAADAERGRADGERARLEATVGAARVEAERADRAKDEFIATVSHELRTPLNAVLGWARLLRLGKLDPGTTARAVETIERSAQAQAQIVDDLLDVSRLVKGELRLDVRPVELVPIVEAAVDAVRPAANARGVSIVTMLVPRAGPVAGDPGRLQQVIWNLLSNAVKFTSQGGRIEARLEQEANEVVVRVRDTGAGIDAAFLPHVFERFRQADSSSTRLHGGLGLGLAIVRYLVEAHGGSVAAASDGPGRGATFTVRLPVTPVRTGRVPLAPDAGAVDAAARRFATLDRVRVLVVDDDPDTIEVVRQVLESAGAQVIAAASAREALAALSARPPDVLLSDLGMPGEDGYAFIRKVRSLDPARGGRVPAAALTAYTRSEDRREALLAGFQVYLPKPVEPAELTATVARLAGRMH